MRIALITETLHPGGAETFVIRLANTLSREHEVALIIFYPHIAHPELVSRLSSKVKIYRLKISYLALVQKADSLFRMLSIDVSLLNRQLVKQTAAVIKEFRPDVVQGNLFKTDWVISKVRKQSHFAFISTIHGDYASFYNGEISARLLNIKKKMSEALASIQAIICLSEEHVSFFKQHYPEVSGKLKLIYNGYEPSDEAYQRKNKAELGLPENTFLFGMVSRGVEKKGWKKAIDAFEQSALPRACLVLVGSGEHLNELMKTNTNPNIIFTGFSPQPLEYIQHFDVCLLPTLFHYESLPTVIIEYLFCGKPVIATDVGEIKKMLTDQTGRLAGDVLSFTDRTVDVNALSVLMNRYFTDSSYRVDKKGSAASAFTKFQMVHCYALYLQAYREAVAVFQAGNKT